jgi:hypothetical protein
MLRVALLSLLLIFPVTAPAVDEFHYTISADMAEHHPDLYNRTLNRMHHDLAGKTPKKFTINGVEYDGVFMKRGSSTDVYTVFEGGEPSVIRIPSNSMSYAANENFVKGMAKAELHGVPHVKVLATSSAENPVVVKVAYFRGEPADEILEKFLKNPNDVHLQKQVAAIKVYLKESGHFDIEDGGLENISVGVRNRKPVAELIDIGDSEESFKPAASYGKSKLGRDFDWLKQRAEAKAEMAGDPRPASEVLKPVSDLEADLMGKAYPEEFKSAAKSGFRSRLTARGVFRKFATTEEVSAGDVCRVESGSATSLSLSRTLGTSIEVLSAVGIVLALVDTDSNPFAGDAIGVPCSSANADKGRVKCEWESLLNPFNDNAHCTVITEIHHTGKHSFVPSRMADEEACTVRYDAFGFSVDDSKSKTHLKNLGVFNSRGAKLTTSDAAGYHAALRTRLHLKLSGDFDLGGQSFPAPDPWRGPAEI